MIQDSGERREFESGAVRDIQEGKGRCDLLPLAEVAKWLATNDPYIVRDPFIAYMYLSKDDVQYLYLALDEFINAREWDRPTAILEVSKHFEEGMKKYGVDNWRKGIPTSSFFDSAIRHYLKWLRGDDEERHDRAVVWNVLCMIWTIQNKPEWDDMVRKEKEDG